MRKTHCCQTWPKNDPSKRVVRSKGKGSRSRSQRTFAVAFEAQHLQRALERLYVCAWEYVYMSLCVCVCARVLLALCISIIKTQQTSWRQTQRTSVCVYWVCLRVCVCVLLTGLLKSTQAQLDPRAMRPQSMQQTLLQIAPANALALSLSFTHTHTHSHMVYPWTLLFAHQRFAKARCVLRFEHFQASSAPPFRPAAPRPLLCISLHGCMCVSVSMCSCAFLLHAVRRSNISVYHWKIYARIFQTVFTKLYRMYFFIFIFPSFWASFFFIYFQCSVAFIWGFWGVAYISRGAFLSILYGSGPKNSSL